MTTNNQQDDKMRAEFEGVRKGKPWMKQPGECFDKKGYPIYPGDLIRSPHFIGPRKKRYWLYHVATYKQGAMHLTPAAWLDETKTKSGGQCLMSQDMMSMAEILCGSGPGEFYSYEQRKRNKRVNND